MMPIVIHDRFKSRTIMRLSTWRPTGYKDGDPIGIDINIEIPSGNILFQADLDDFIEAIKKLESYR